GQEWQTPTPGHERIAGVSGLVTERGHQDEEETIGQEETERGTQLRPHRGAGTVAGLGVLAGQQRGTGPFPAEAEALAETHEREQRGGDDTDLVIGGQQTDEDGGDTHGQQRTDQGGLAPHTVTEMPEDDRSQGTGDEGQAEGGE